MSKGFVNLETLYKYKTKSLSLEHSLCKGLKYGMAQDGERFHIAKILTHWSLLQTSLQLTQALLLARSTGLSLPDGLIPTISDLICKCCANIWQNEIANLVINEGFHEVSESDVGGCVNSGS